MYASTDLTKTQAGRSMNVYFQPQVYQYLREAVPSRRISKFINELILERLDQKQDLERERIKQSLILSEQLRRQSSDYQALQDLEATALHDYSLTHE